MQRNVDKHAATDAVLGFDGTNFSAGVEADLFPEISDEWETAGLFDFHVEDEGEYEIVEWWLYALNDPNVPVLFLIERCCHDGELLPLDIRETRLKDFP